MDEMEASSSQDIVDIVILPPNSGDQNIPSGGKQDDDEEILDVDRLLQNVPGEVTVHYNDLELSEEENEEPTAGNSQQGRRTEEVSQELGELVKVGDEKLEQRKVIRNYNLADRLCASYHPRLRVKKW